MIGLWTHNGWKLEVTDCPDMHDGQYRAWLNSPQGARISTETGPTRHTAILIALHNARNHGAPQEDMIALARMVGQTG